MKDSLFYTVWIVGLIISLASLYFGYGITAILGISAPYYLTKYLLVKNKDEYNECEE